MRYRATIQLAILFDSAAEPAGANTAGIAADVLADLVGSAAPDVLPDWVTVDWSEAVNVRPAGGAE